MPTNAGPDTNQFRCNACGRYFNTAEELGAHEPECRLAKMSTPEGAAELKREDSHTHQRNDKDADQHPFDYTKPV